MSGHDKLVSFLLRTGLAVVFLYAAIASFLEPMNWIGFLPQFMKDIFPAEPLLSAFSVYELFLALWLLSGKKVVWSSLLAAATLCAIIVTNITQLEIIFRDIAILFAALALSALHYRGEKLKTENTG